MSAPMANMNAHQISQSQPQQQAPAPAHPQQPQQHQARSYNNNSNRGSRGGAHHSNSRNYNNGGQQHFNGQNSFQHNGYVPKFQKSYPPNGNPRHYFNGSSSFGVQHYQQQQQASNQPPGSLGNQFQLQTPASFEENKNLPPQAAIKNRNNWQSTNASAITISEAGSSGLPSPTDQHSLVDVPAVTNDFNSGIGFSQQNYGQYPPLPFLPYQQFPVQHAGATYYMSPGNSFYPQSSNGYMPNFPNNYMPYPGIGNGFGAFPPAQGYICSRCKCLEYDMSATSYSTTMASNAVPTVVPENGEKSQPVD